MPSEIGHRQLIFIYMGLLRQVTLTYTTHPFFPAQITFLDFLDPENGG